MRLRAKRRPSLLRPVVLSPTRLVLVWVAGFEAADSGQIFFGEVFNTSLSPVLTCLLTMKVRRIFLFSAGGLVIIFVSSGRGGVVGPFSSILDTVKYFSRRPPSAVRSPVLISLFFAVDAMGLLSPPRFWDHNEPPFSSFPLFLPSLLNWTRRLRLKFPVPSEHFCPPLPPRPFLSVVAFSPAFD